MNNTKLRMRARVQVSRVINLDIMRKWNEFKLGEAHGQIHLPHTSFPAPAGT
jgi:hypothetical protein